MHYIIIICLLCLSACFSGLNLGMMGLSPHDLKRKADLGDKRAKKIYAVRKKGNLLLVTLLLGNVCVNAAIAVFMGSMFSGVVATIISTLMITILGEIFPQAIFSRFALTIGSRVTWLVRVFIFVLYPIAAPISFILNKALGEELPTLYSKNELRAIISEHSKSSQSDTKEHEFGIAAGAFTFGDKMVKDVMVPRSAVISVGQNDILDKKTLMLIGKYGYPRIPVINKESYEVQGIIYTYDLLIPKNLNRPAIEVCDKEIFYVKEDDKLAHVLDAFIKKQRHLFIVINSFDEYSGIITIEDILEDIIGKEIIDEYDVPVKIVKKNKKRMAKG